MIFININIFCYEYNLKNVFFLNENVIFPPELYAYVTFLYSCVHIFPIVILKIVFFIFFGKLVLNLLKIKTKYIF